MLLAKIKPFKRRLEEMRETFFSFLPSVNDSSLIRVQMSGLNMSQTHGGKDLMYVVCILMGFGPKNKLNDLYGHPNDPEILLIAN